MGHAVRGIVDRLEAVSYDWPTGLRVRSFHYALDPFS